MLKKLNLERQLEKKKMFIDQNKERAQQMRKKMKRD